MTNTLRKMTIVIILLALIEFVIFSLLISFKGAIGVVFGSLGALINLFALWSDVKKNVSKKKAMSVIGYLMRYILSAMILIFAGLLSTQSIIGAFFGLMNVKFAAFLSWR